MNLIAMLLEWLLGSLPRRMRLQPIPVSHRAPLKQGAHEWQRAAVADDAQSYHREVALVAGLGWLTGSMRTTYPDAAADGLINGPPEDFPRTRRSWSG